MNGINIFIYWGLGIALVILSLISITISSAFISKKPEDYKANFDNIARYVTHGISTVGAVLAGALLGLLAFEAPTSIDQLAALIGGFIAVLMFGIVTVSITSAFTESENT